MTLHRTVLAVLIGLLLGNLAEAEVVPAPATTDPIQQAIEKGVAYLYATQKDGSWEVAPKRVGTDHAWRTFQGDVWGGNTAMAVYALLSAGEKPTDPRLAKAIEFLKRSDQVGVYNLGVRCVVWSKLPQTQEIKQLLKRDSGMLMNGMKTSGPALGFYYYLPNGGKNEYDLSVSQFAVLGMWAAADAGVEIPDRYWEIVDTAWRKNQLPDGGWAYCRTKPGSASNPSATMTLAGVATLFIAQDHLRSGAAGCKGRQPDTNIDRGIAVIEKNMQTILNGKVEVWPHQYYGIFGLERVGVASGYKYFGSIDWFAQLSSTLIKSQSPDGRWNSGIYDAVNTSFAIISLARGRAPVVMNKLNYDNNAAAGDSKADRASRWDQRPHDVANAVKYVSKQLERDLNWQIVKLDAPADDLHDAPILYISGSEALHFTDAEEAKLKTFVEQGGLILGHPDCADPDFTKSFKSLGMKLFKDAGEFRKLEQEHPIYTRQQFPWKSWKNKPDLQGLSNGVRELMLIIPTGDPGKSWQLADFKTKEEQFQLVSDIFLYATEGKDLRNKGATHIVHPNPTVTTTKTFKIARINAGDNPDPEPGGWRRLSAVMHNDSGIDLETPLIKLEPNALDGFKLAHLTGTRKIKLNDDQQKVIKSFIDAGGTLVIDAASGNTEFSAAIDEQMQQIFGEDAKQLGNSIDPNHALYNATGKPMGNIQFRSFAGSVLPRGLKTPLLRGITIKDRLAVIVSHEDLSGGMVGQQVDGIVGYTPDSATAIMKNIVLFANR